jgi:CBS domain-containing protein
MPTPEQLLEMSEKVKIGQRAETTVRSLLSWYGAYRRSWRNVERIRADLEALQLSTFPDFEGEYIDGSVVFKSREEMIRPADELAKGTQRLNEALPNASAKDATAEPPTAEGAAAAQLADPAHRINRLASANKPPVSVKPDATVAEAITLMLLHDYSQLPVMQNERDVKGIISWHSLGARLAIGCSCEFVRDCMEKHQEIRSDASLFDAVGIIAEHDCVLIRAPNKTIGGIVTGSDISTQFKQLAEPFLFLGDIERHVRYLISANFTKEELQQAKDPEDTERQIGDVSDLALGEYVRLLQNPTNWEKLKMRLDRKTFVEQLDRVREIRNDVMHFDPDPIQSEDLRLLKEFAGLLGQWQSLVNQEGKA